MTVTAATTPQYPAAGRASLVAFTVAGAGNYLKGYFTDAPIGSEAKTELLNTGATRFPAFVTDANKLWQFTPDVGGVYSLEIEQYTKGATGYGGGYQDSPSGYLTEALVATSSLTISVGQKVTQKIGFGPDTATLTLFVIGTVVRATTFDAYGFTSPLIDDAKTAKAATAALNSGVLAAVSGLTDQDVSALLGTVQAAFNTMLGAYQLHANSSSYHPNADHDNNPRPSDQMSSPPSPEGIKRSVSKFLRLLDQHMRNDDGGSATSIGGTGSQPYHVSNLADWANVLLTTSTGDVLDTFSALADSWRAYIGHCANTAVHTVADVTNNIPAALPPLLALHALFLAEIQKQSPTAPASVNAGVTALVHAAGFEES